MFGYSYPVRNAVFTSDTWNAVASAKFVLEDHEVLNDQSVITLPDELIRMFLPSECQLCGVFFICEPTAFTHYEGKVHQKKVALYMKEKHGIVGSLLKRREKFSPIFCDVCQVTLTSQIVYYTHMAGKTHAKNTQNRSFVPTKPMMEDPVDFMYDLPQPPPPPKLNKFVCQVCRVSTNTEVQLRNHELGSKHRRKMKAMQEGEDDYEEDCEEWLYGKEEQEKDEMQSTIEEQIDESDMNQPLVFNTNQHTDGHNITNGSANLDLTTSQKSEKDNEGALKSEKATVPRQVITSEIKSTNEQTTTAKHLESSEEDICQILKANPGSASILHKYKSALNVQNGDKITLTMPLKKSFTRKSEAKKPLYLPPEIRSKIIETQKTLQTGSALIPKQYSQADTSKNGKINSGSNCKPYYNADVDFHRKKTPSPSPSAQTRSPMRGRSYNRDVKLYQNYLRDTNGKPGYCRRKGWFHRVARRERCWNWQQGYEERGRNPYWETSRGGSWLRGRLPGEGRFETFKQDGRNRNEYWRFGGWKYSNERYRNKCEGCSKEYSRCKCRTRKQRHSKTRRTSPSYTTSKSSKNRSLSRNRNTKRSRYMSHARSSYSISSSSESRRSTRGDRTVSSRRNKSTSSSSSRSSWSGTSRRSRDYSYSSSE